mmetsp:Transcript_8152/g.17662  ORF Transcript_8152/g.17662 Transcript_8152/m.17662 type:complete len:130 (+) Transcript_8152:42-431(+)
MYEYKSISSKAAGSNIAFWFRRSESLLSSKQKKFHSVALGNLMRPNKSQPTEALQHMQDNKRIHSAFLPILCRTEATPTIHLQRNNTCPTHILPHHISRLSNPVRGRRKDRRRLAVCKTNSQQHHCSTS